MSAGTPYIGSKINLISKAEIRYQGTLYQVDTKEATVTLAKVRSFGTENRQVPKPILPRNEIYEFIIFRGSDIKDLNVIDVPAQPGEAEDPAPQDPAIVSATQAAPLQTLPAPSAQQLPPGSTQSRPATHNYTPFPPPNMYSPFGMPYVRPPVMMGARGTVPPPPLHPSHPAHAVPIVSQPQTAAVAPPTHNQPPPPPSMSAPPAQAPVPVDTLSSVFGGAPLLHRPAPVSSEAEPQASSTPMVPATVTTEATPKASVSLESESPGLVSRAQPSVPVGNQQLPPSVVNNNVSDGGSGDQAVVDSTTEPEEDGPIVRGGKGGGRGTGRRGNNRNRQQDGRGGYRGSGNRRGYRGNYRGPPRGGYRSSQGGQRPSRGGNSGSNGPVYRYESEFDFESANARFKREAFEEEFKQLHVDERSDSGSSRRVSETNGEEDGSSPGGEVSVVNSETLSDNEADSVLVEDEFYDKSKSFFDSLSCENNGPGRRPDRNAERELNTETFGVSNFRGHRRYQGRGRGRGRGRGYQGNKGGQRYGRTGDGNHGNRQGRGYTDRNKTSTGQN